MLTKKLCVSLKIIMIANNIQHKPINDLILFCLFNVEGRCGFERLIKECFHLFPEVFCFENYKNWPDARKLDRPLRTLRDNRLVTGDPSTDFELTSQGKQQAVIIAKSLRQKKLL